MAIRGNLCHPGYEFAFAVRLMRLLLLITYYTCPDWCLVCPYTPILCGPSPLCSHSAITPL